MEEGGMLLPQMGFIHVPPKVIIAYKKDQIIFGARFFGNQKDIAVFRRGMRPRLHTTLTLVVSTM